MLEVPRSHYVRVRARSNWFVVLPSHVVPEVEQVVEEHDGFWILAKSLD
jgi:hypothetical protein